MLQRAYCIVFSCFTYIATTYKVQFFTVMKDSLSLLVSNIHKHFQDKRILVRVGSLLLIASDPGDLKVKVYSSLDLIRSVFSGCEYELKDLKM